MDAVAQDVGRGVVDVQTLEKGEGEEAARVHTRIREVDGAGAEMYLVTIAVEDGALNCVGSETHRQMQRITLY